MIVSRLFDSSLVLALGAAALVLLALWWRTRDRRAQRALTVAGEVRLHPALVSRFGKRCTTILDEAKQLQQEGDYQPANVKADTLPAFA